MSRTTSVALAAHLAGRTTTLAWCWRIVRVDGTEFFFTAHDADLVVDGDTYEAAVGFNASAIAADGSLSVSNSEVTGIFDSTALDADAMRSGLFDFAEVYSFAVNWADLSQGKMKMQRAHLGEVRYTPSDIFITELRGMTQRLVQRTNNIYRPTCSRDLGDTKCQVNLALFTNGGTVASVADQSNFAFNVTDSRAADGWYSYGVVKWVTGNNAGRNMEVKNFVMSNFSVELAWPMPREIQIGDTFTIVAGCDKKFSTCRDKFNNVNNFRGWPHIPGINGLAATPRAG